eukprot:scaffold116_cov220-Alexandrium_tamarense.AAC.9
MMVELPGRGEMSAKMKFMPVLDVPSEIVEVRYKAGRWEDVVEALVSNEGSRTDEVILLFERPIAGGEESTRQHLLVSTEETEYELKINN